MDINMDYYDFSFIIDFVYYYQSCQNIKDLIVLLRHMAKSEMVELCYQIFNVMVIGNKLMVSCFLFTQ